MSNKENAMTTADTTDRSEFPAVMKMVLTQSPSPNWSKRLDGAEVQRAIADLQRFAEHRLSISIELWRMYDGEDSQVVVPGLGNVNLLDAVRVWSTEGRLAEVRVAGDLLTVVLKEVHWSKYGIKDRTQGQIESFTIDFQTRVPKTARLSLQWRDNYLEYRLGPSFAFRMQLRP